MTKEEQKDINEQIVTACYDRIKFSSLWNSRKGTNGDIDKLSENFGALLSLQLEELISSAELEVEREAELLEVA